MPGNCSVALDKMTGGVLSAARSEAGFGRLKHLQKLYVNSLCTCADWWARTGALSATTMSTLAIVLRECHQTRHVTLVSPESRLTNREYSKGYSCVC